MTGAAGQDGSYLLERLLSDGWQVHGVVRPGAGDLAGPVRTHRADVRGPGAFTRLLADVEPDVVFHLAGLSSVARSWQEPALTAAVNGGAVAELLAACAAARRPPRVLLAGSGEVFSGSGMEPQDERTPVRPTSPYGAAKAYALHLGGVYRTAGLHVSSALLYSHESPRRPLAFVTRKITSAAAAISRGRGSPLHLGNLDAVRDWGWAPDYVDAMVRMSRAEEPADHVVATGRGRSVAEFVAAAFAAAGAGDPAEHVVVDPALYRPVAEVPLVGDATALRQRLGWETTVGFEELVRRMVEADLARLDGV